MSVSLPSRRRAAAVLSACLAFGVAACGGGGSDGPSPVTEPPVVASVGVTPISQTLSPGGTVTLTATARDASGNVLVGRPVTWSSSAPSIATVSGGLVTAIAVGNASIVATVEGRTGEVPIQVVPTPVATVVVTPDSSDVAVGSTRALAAATRDAAGAALTGRTVTWTSSNIAVATVSTAGVVTGVVPGTVTITATSETRVGTARVRIVPIPVATVILTPDSSDIRLGSPQSLTVVTRDAAGATLTGRTVTWTSSDATVATVNAAGLVTGVLPGTVTISATSETRVGTARVRIIPTSLTSIVDSIRTAFNLPALGAAIVKRDAGVTAIGVAGTRRFGADFPVTLDDKWHLGSNTKTMTGLLTAMTVKAGRIAFEDKMTTRYPELAGLVRPEFANVTVRQLVTMQSGIIGNPNFTPTGTPAQMRTAVDNWAVQQPAASTVGNYYYSNIAYQILGEIVGRAWGTGYEQALRDRVWTPLGVTTGGFGPTTAVGASNNPVGHFPSGTGGWTVCESCDNFWATGSGMVHMSLPDWARIVREILRADVGQSTLLSQAESRTLMTATTTISAAQAFGMGWIVFTNSPGQRIVTFDGTNVRNRSRSLVYPDAGIAFLVTTNAGDPAEDGGVPNAALNAMITRLQSFNQTGR